MSDLYFDLRLALLRRSVLSDIRLPLYIWLALLCLILWRF